MQALGKNCSLFCLNLSSNSGPHQNKVTSDALINAPLALSKNTTLGILNLSGNMIGNDGVKYLAKGLLKNSTLLWLNISQTSIDKLSAKYIIRILNKSRLTHLDISRNKLGNKVFLLIIT